HIARLRAAGAIIVGKTNTPEFEVGINTRNPLFGHTVHPRDARLGCGGSSGGSAVALAAGMCALADGTDHGGSVRIPASLVGVVGLRPSPGRIPLFPAAGVADPFSVPGPLARSVRDVALMMSVMAGPDPRVPISIDEPAPGPELDPDVRGWRIAWTRDLMGLFAVDDEVGAAVELAARRFAELGCDVEEAAPDWRDAREIIEVVRAYRTTIVMSELRAQDSPSVCRSSVAGTPTATCCTRASRSRTRHDDAAAGRGHRRRGVRRAPPSCRGRHACCGSGCAHRLHGHESARPKRFPQRIRAALRPARRQRRPARAGRPRNIRQLRLLG